MTGDARRLSVLAGMGLALAFIGPILLGWGIYIAISLCRDAISAAGRLARR